VRRDDRPRAITLGGNGGWQNETARFLQWESVGISGNERTNERFGFARACGYSPTQAAANPSHRTRLSQLSVGSVGKCINRGGGGGRGRGRGIRLLGDAQCVAWCMRGTRCGLWCRCAYDRCAHDGCALVASCTTQATLGCAARAACCSARRSWRGL
jgi:hypothetical protein